MAALNIHFLANYQGDRSNFLPLAKFLSRFVAIENLVDVFKSGDFPIDD